MIELRQLRIGPSSVPGLDVGQRSRLRAEGVIVEEATTAGVIAASGGRLELVSSVVRNTRGLSNGFFGRGVSLESGARADIQRTIIDGNREAGLLVLDVGTQLILEDAVVRDTQSRSADDGLGSGLIVILGAQAQVRRAQLTRNRHAGIFVNGASSEALLEDVVVDDIFGRASDGLSAGLGVEGGARAEVRRAAFVQNREVGIHVFGEGRARAPERHGPVQRPRSVVRPLGQRDDRAVGQSAERHLVQRTVRCARAAAVARPTGLHVDDVSVAQPSGHGVKAGAVRSSVPPSPTGPASDPASGRRPPAVVSSHPSPDRATASRMKAARR